MLELTIFQISKFRRSGGECETRTESVYQSRKIKFLNKRLRISNEWNLNRTWKIDVDLFLTRSRWSFSSILPFRVNLINLKNSVHRSSSTEIKNSKTKELKTMKRFKTKKRGMLRLRSLSWRAFNLKTTCNRAQIER